MNPKIFLINILVLFTIQNCLGQFHQDIFPNQEGETLRLSLVGEYKPGIVYPYSSARDILYADVFAKNDSLTCVYSGHTLYLDPGLDPTDAMYMDGDNNGINTEHIYPQSKGAENGNAKSDMHHLAPTRILVNSTRGSDPFAEISDPSTDLWHYLNQSNSVTPNQNIDRYSESRPGSFEPREDFKGDVARAVFYFYAMYKNQADAADPNYFDSMVGDLCQWHTEDPVNQKEFDRTWKIAEFQQDKPNPFIIDCTLAQRLYCSNACDPWTDVEDINPNVLTLFEVAPNPFDNETSITLNIQKRSDLKIQLFDMTGKEIGLLFEEEVNAGIFEKSSDIRNNEHNVFEIYLLKLSITTSSGTTVYSKKLIQQ